MNQNVLEFVLFEDCVVDIEDGVIRIVEDVFNIFFSQVMDEYICVGELFSIYVVFF